MPTVTGQIDVRVVPAFTGDRRGRAVSIHPHEPCIAVAPFGDVDQCSVAREARTTGDALQDGHGRTPDFEIVEIERYRQQLILLPKEKMACRRVERSRSPQRQLLTRTRTNVQNGQAGIFRTEDREKSVSTVGKMHRVPVTQAVGILQMR